MNIGTLLLNVEDEYKKEFRTYEKKVKKLYNAKSRLQFNQICYDNDLQPSTLYFFLISLRKSAKIGLWPYKT